MSARVVARAPAVLVLAGLALGAVGLARLVHRIDDHERRAAMTASVRRGVRVRAGNLGAPRHVRALLVVCTVLGTAGLGMGTVAAGGALAVTLAVATLIWAAAGAGIREWVAVAA